MTGALLVYANLRGHGFRIFPLQLNKAPKYGAMYFGAFIGCFMAIGFTTKKLGDEV